MTTWIEAFKLSLIACACGVAVGVIWGFPEAASGQEDAVCTGPVPSEPKIQWASLAEAKTAFDRSEVRFIDARSKEAFQAGHIAGAFHLPIENGTLNRNRLTKLDPNQDMIVYCDTQGSCAASTRLAALLWSEGFMRVRVLEGGMPAWMQAAYPAEAGACQDCQ
ncbi:MAG: rhodanese-like domain-containing protein [Myxococcales bacterium]|nr:MAG: rhodanese-like domain-containing protein [Myxococcales bacterium]